MPYFAGVIVGFWAYDTGSGIIGGVIVGAVAGAATFVLFRLLLLVTRPTWMKLLVTLVSVAPAAMAAITPRSAS